MWTGNHLQVVLMSIGVGEDIGLEVHPGVRSVSTYRRMGRGLFKWVAVKII